MRGAARLIVVLLVLGFLSGGVGLAADRRVGLSLDVTEKYNDNIFYTADDEIDDYITVVTGELTLSRRSERSDAGLSALVRNSFYAEEHDLDGLDQYYAGHLTHALTTRFKAGVEASFARDTQPDRDIDATGLVLGTNTRDSQHYGGSLEYGLSEISTAALSYNYYREDYKDIEGQNYSRQEGGLLLTHRLDKYFANTMGRLNLIYVKYDFEAMTIDYYAGTLGFLYQFSELWNLAMDLGARYTETSFDLPGGGEEKVDGWGGVGSLKAVFQGEYAATSLTLSHDVGAASGRDGSVERSSAVADMNYRFAEKIRCGVLAGYFLNRTDAGDLSRTMIDERTLRLKPYLRWGLLDDLVLELSYQYSGLKDEVDDQTTENHVAMLRLTYNVFDF